MKGGYGNWQGNMTRRGPERNPRVKVSLDKHCLFHRVSFSFYRRNINLERFITKHTREAQLNPTSISVGLLPRMIVMNIKVFGYFFLPTNRFLSVISLDQLNYP
jgi:hypothetical protein